MLKLRKWININKINWNVLTDNPNAIKLFKENKNKINWYIFLNPNIFTLIKQKNE